MTTEDLLARLVENAGEIKFWLTPSRTRIGIELTPRDGTPPIARFGSDTLDINRPLFLIYDEYVQRLVTQTKEVHS